jgi:nitrate/nitrite transport system permease protein
MSKLKHSRRLLISLMMLAIFLGAWQLATQPKESGAAGRRRQRVRGADGQGARRSPASRRRGMVGKAFVTYLSDPFYDKGPNDKGIGIQLAIRWAGSASASCWRWLIALPVGFMIGMSPLLYKALDPFIQVLKPISPLAWMPLALYSLKDSDISGIFVIFICSVWPMLINTAFGVASVRRDWINVARTLEVRPLRKALPVILPAAAPTILTGMRISMGIAWLVIVAAEMLVGGTGIGYFVWNEWNNLALPNVIFAVSMIGVVGMLLDRSSAGCRSWSPTRNKQHHEHGLPQHRKPAKVLPRPPTAPVFENINFTSTRASSSASSATPAAARPPSSTCWPGWKTASDGNAFMDGREVKIGPSLDRGVVFQSHALMPWMSVLGNVAFAVQVEVAGLGARKRSRHCSKYLEMVGLGHACTRSRRSSPAA